MSKDTSNGPWGLMVPGRPPTPSEGAAQQYCRVGPKETQKLRAFENGTCLQFGPDDPICDKIDDTDLAFVNQFALVDKAVRDVRVSRIGHEGQTQSIDEEGMVVTDPFDNFRTQTTDRSGLKKVTVDSKEYYQVPSKYATCDNLVSIYSSANKSDVRGSGFVGKSEDRRFGNSGAILGASQKNSQRGGSRHRKSNRHGNKNAQERIAGIPQEHYREDQLRGGPVMHMKNTNLIEGGLQARYDQLAGGPVLNMSNPLLEGASMQKPHMNAIVRSEDTFKTATTSSGFQSGNPNSKGQNMASQTLGGEMSAIQPFPAHIVSGQRFPYAAPRPQEAYMPHYGSSPSVIGNPMTNMAYGRSVRTMEMYAQQRHADEQRSAMLANFLKNTSLTDEVRYGGGQNYKAGRSIPHHNLDMQSQLDSQTSSGFRPTTQHPGNGSKIGVGMPTYDNDQDRLGSAYRVARASHALQDVMFDRVSVGENMIGESKGGRPRPPRRSRNNNLSKKADTEYSRYLDELNAESKEQGDNMLAGDAISGHTQVQLNIQPPTPAKVTAKLHDGDDEDDEMKDILDAEKADWNNLMSTSQNHKVSSHHLAVPVYDPATSSFVTTPTIDMQAQAALTSAATSSGSTNQDIGHQSEPIQKRAKLLSPISFERPVLPQNGGKDNPDPEVIAANPRSEALNLVDAVGGFAQTKSVWPSSESGPEPLSQDITIFGELPGSVTASRDPSPAAKLRRSFSSRGLFDKN